MKTLITGLLSALLIVLTFQATPANINNSVVHAEAKQVTTEAVEATDPTPSPQPVPTIEPEQPHPVGCENYRTLISQYFGAKTEVFLQIANKESGCNPEAVGDTRVIGGIYAPSCGLFQVRTLSSRPSCEELKDPATNIAWAHRIFQGQGFKAWSVCKAKVECK